MAVSKDTDNMTETNQSFQHSWTIYVFLFYLSK